jgi:phage baseplate assembly protein W
MTQTEDRWGVDLRLLGTLDRQNSRDRANDLFVTQTDPVDLAILNGADNLRQALLLRFLTPLGELTALGHPDYGSRLYELIGELNSEANRSRAKVFVLQALAAEPRVKTVRSVQVVQSKIDRTQVDIHIVLTAIDSDTDLNFVFPFFLERGTGA